MRALRFLEGFLQRDSMQKAAFLKDLEGLWPRCDARVLRYRVLPPLLGECRNESLQPIILPLIMRIIQQQEPQVRLMIKRIFSERFASRHPFSNSGRKNKG